MAEPFDLATLKTVCEQYPGWEGPAPPDQIVELHARLVAFRQWLVTALRECDGDIEFPVQARVLRNVLAELDAAVLLERPEGEKP